jgi:hypothetical protein
MTRFLLTINLALACVGVALAGAAAPAAASHKQISIFEDDSRMFANPAATLTTFRLLGAQVVKVTVHWRSIAPRPNSNKRPGHFNGDNPAAYPRHNWTILDEIDRDARADGIQVYFDLNGGAPAWATGPHHPAGEHPGWDPSPSKFAAFVHAVGKRYDGSYKPPGGKTPLPRVSYWSVWSEPNLGYSLSPQGVLGDIRVENSGHMYRNLLNAAWRGLHNTGHGRDTILIDELAPRAGNRWGEFQAMKPLVFLRALYCVDSNYHELRGADAAIRGCPTTAAGSRHFRAANPALFQATGVADHPWMRWYPPNREIQNDPDYTSLKDIGQLTGALDRLERVYGSHKRFPIYNTEFGYITDPPNNSTIRVSGQAPAKYPSPETAAYYLNWAEYLSWKNPRIASFDQYLLRDPDLGPGRYTGWASGLLGPRQGTAKVTFGAWRLPLYLPVTSFSPGHKLEVWGCVRPAAYGALDSGSAQTAEIQFAPGKSDSFKTVKQVTIGRTAGCYFDKRIKFARSGSVRLIYTYPTPDALLPAGRTVFSRHVEITRR